MSKKLMALTALTSFAMLASGQSAATQTPTAAVAAWAGWARCQIEVQGPGYSERQTHTWMMTGATPTIEGAFRVYPATWSVVGGGSLQRTQGTQTLVAQWAINAPATSAPIAVFVRASDGRMFIQARHSQMRAAGAVAGYQQVTIDGKQQPPGQISAEAFEWAFPVIDSTSTSTSINGSSAPGVNGSVGYMQPAGSRGTASCSWQFGQGASAPVPPQALAAVPIPSAPATTSAAPGAPPPTTTTTPTQSTTTTPTQTTPTTTTQNTGTPTQTATTTPVQVTTTSPTTTAPTQTPTLPTQTATTTPVRVTTTSPTEPATSGATGSTPTSTTSGRYRVTVTGFRVNRATFDERFNGNGDEVYAAVGLLMMDRRDTSVTQPWTVIKSDSYGDVGRNPGFVRAGSFTPTGGLWAGDTVPSGNDPRIASGPPSATRFPLLVWEGTLRDGIDAVIVKPTLWETDGQIEDYNRWATLRDPLGYFINPQFGGSRLVNDNAAQVAVIKARAEQGDITFFRGTAVFVCYNSETFGVIGSGAASCRNGIDRPIGMTGGACTAFSFGGRDDGWCDMTAVLTREGVERALSASFQVGGAPSGSMTIPLIETSGVGVIDGGFDGSYELYVRVERLP